MRHGHTCIHLYQFITYVQCRVGMQKPIYCLRVNMSVNTSMFTSIWNGKQTAAEQKASGPANQAQKLVILLIIDQMCCYVLLLTRVIRNTYVWKTLCTQPSRLFRESDGSWQNKHYCPIVAVHLLLLTLP